MSQSQFTKRLLKSQGLQVALSYLISFVLRLIYATNRVEKIVPAESVAYLTGDKPAIFCFWHGRMIVHPFVKPPGRNMFVLISHHRDGALANATMKRFGIDSVRGSKRVGTTKAVRDLLAITERGDNICITPDGPRGPFQKAAIGGAYVASKTGYPLIPITFAATRYRRLRSWDKFMVPLPFGRIRFVAGAPIFVSDETHEALDAATVALQAQLDQVTETADALCGVTP